MINPEVWESHNLSVLLAVKSTNVLYQSAVSYAIVVSESLTGML